jgi:alkylhydroperoxidase family enzyme
VSSGQVDERKVNQVKLDQEIASDLGFGIVPNLFSTADKNPDVKLALWRAFRHIVLEGCLPRTVKEMMGVIVSRQAGSSYAAQVHLHALTLQGIEAPILDALDRGEAPEGVPEKTQALLHFAYGAARNPHDPAQLELLGAADLSEAERLEAVAVVGLFRMVNTWTDVLAIPLDAL